MKAKKVMVIGIDGATWRLLDSWIAEGSLPNFERMVKEGFSSCLESTIPPMTAPSWLSFSTGRNPGRHGVFDFYRRVGFKREPLDSRALKGREVWEILSEQGKKVIVINSVLAYPVKKVNGFLIAGMMTPSYEVDYTYPRNLKKRLEKWGYQIGVELEVGMRSNWARSLVMTKNREKRQKLIDSFNQIAEKRWEVFKKLGTEDNWDFAFIMFEGVDRLQHYYWQKDDLYVVESHYKALDKILGEAGEMMEKKGILMIISDHGFTPIKKKFYINNFLEKHGFLERRKENNLSQFVLRQGKRLALKLADWGLPQEKILTNRHFFKLYNRLYRPGIDAEAKAFMLNETSRGIWVGYEDEGEYEKVRDFIIRELNRLRDPGTGKRILRAFKRENIYQGREVGKAPDILLVTYPGYSLEVTIEEGLEKPFLKPTSLGERNADHEQEGVLIISGQKVKKIKKRAKRVAPKMVDLAPTILKLLDVHVPIDIDGEALEEIFDEVEA